MADDITTLEPETLWRYFAELCEIPHCSKFEEQMGDYVEAVAKDLGLDSDRDATGNLIVRKPATPGLENAPTVVLQSHIDMVCEKNSDVDHDFQKDPIIPVIDGKWLVAKGTTLGADNGIGVAAMLAAMELSFEHGPLEFVFTVDEETGLNGAIGLSSDVLKGKYFLNLDSEEEGEICIGCAGGADTNMSIPLKSVQTTEQDVNTVEIEVIGLRGGHSGVDIHEGRANAIKVLVRMLHKGMGGADCVHLHKIEGGNKRNAIPREARAIISVPVKCCTGFMLDSLEEADAIANEFKTLEPDFQVNILAGKFPNVLYDAESSAKAIKALHGIPCGVMQMSADIPGLVETSTNVGVVATGENELKVTISTRSSIRSALEWVRGMHRSIAQLADGSVEELDGYPGWAPDINSRALEVTKRVHMEVFGKEPTVKAIHAGLECGLLKEKYPDMDMVSVGPQIENPHSPSERVEIQSVENFWNYLQAILKGFAE